MIEWNDWKWGVRLLLNKPIETTTTIRANFFQSHIVPSGPSNRWSEDQSSIHSLCDPADLPIIIAHTRLRICSFHWLPYWPNPLFSAVSKARRFFNAGNGSFVAMTNAACPPSALSTTVPMPISLHHSHQFWNRRFCHFRTLKFPFFLNFFRWISSLPMHGYVAKKN